MLAVHRSGLAAHTRTARHHRGADARRYSYSRNLGTHVPRYVAYAKQLAVGDATSGGASGGAAGGAAGGTTNPSVVC